MTLWDEDLFKSINIRYSSHWLGVSLRLKVSGCCFHLFNIYGPQNYGLKLSLWGELSNSSSSLSSSPIFLIGDFNNVRIESKRANCSIRMREIRGFNSWVTHSSSGLVLMGKK